MPIACGTHLHIRPVRLVNARLLGRLIYASVHDGTATVYSADERRAWMPTVPDGLSWRLRLHQNHGWVAFTGQQPCGLITMTQAGHVDLAYVAPDAHRTGVGTRLLAHAVTEARQMKCTTMTTDASLVAVAFFERHGWRTVRLQRVRRRGVILRNVRMTLQLRQPAHWHHRSNGSRWRRRSASLAESYVSWRMA